MTTVQTVVTFGDSLAWGQGLLDEHKFSSLVRNDLSIRYPSLSFAAINASHSGAPIGFGRTLTEFAVDQEVPVDAPSILLQVARAGAMLQLADVCLCIIVGGINDLGVDNIINPKFAQSEMDRLTDLYCHDHMRELVLSCLSAFSSASVVIAGYYQIVSDRTDRAMLPTLASSVGLFLAGIPGAVVLGIASAAAQQDIARRCLRFANRANARFAEVAAELTKELRASGDRRSVAFADPAFGPQHAAFAPETNLWGARVIADPLDPFSPEDAVIQRRIMGCHAARQSGAVSDYQRCKFASLGHPNPKGARAYATAIGTAIERLAADAGWNPANPEQDAASTVPWIAYLLAY